MSIAACVANALLNAAIAAFVYRAMAFVPVWGERSLAGDTLATTFLLPFFTCLVVTRIVHRRVGSGQMRAIRWHRTDSAILRLLPRRTFPRAMVLGAVVTAAVGLPSVWVLSRLDLVGLAYGPFVAAKTVYAAALAGLVSPLIAVSALGDAKPRVADNRSARRRRSRGGVSSSAGGRGRRSALPR